MMKTVRRFLSTLLVVCMLACILPAAFAAVPFHDVKSSDWYYSAVEYVYNNGLMSGTSTTTFSPNTTTTRGMIVTILHRLEKSPSVSGEAFTDVPAGQYYSAAVAWASKNSIVSGYGNGKFGPNDAITREQMASILYRYAQYKGRSTSTLANITAFSDHTKISSYATTAMRWAVAEGLISGTGNDQLSPTGIATRAQVAAILMRFKNGTTSSGSSSTPQQTPPAENATDTSLNDYYGTWKIDDEITRKQNGSATDSLFGSAYTQYGSELKILENGTFSYYIGAGIGGSGTWNYKNRIFSYEITTYEDGRHETGIITMHQNSSGTIYLSSDHYDIEACWTKSSSSATTTSAWISGIIWEEGSTKLLPNVSISLYDSARSHLLYTTKTYPNGMFEFELTQTGDFDLLFQKTGYQDIIFDDFKFKGNDHEFELEMKAISEPSKPSEDTTPSTKPSQYSKTIYHSTIQNACNELAYSAGNGVIYDLDGNGTEELIMAYDTFINNVPYMIWSCYTYANGTIIPLIEKAPLYIMAGGPRHTISLAEYRGVQYLAVFSTQGNTDGLGLKQEGTWILYNANNTTLHATHTVNYWYELSSTDFATVVDGGCTINGTPYSWDEYQAWEASLNLIPPSCDKYTLNELLALTQ